MSMTCSQRLAAMLCGYQAGLRGSYLRRVLIEAGYSRLEIAAARAALVDVRGGNGGEAWYLRPKERRKRVPRRMGKRIAALRTAMDLTVPHEKPAPQPIPHCLRCGCRIGNRAEGEAMLCLKPLCREAA
jgi:hypothetical protein